MAYRRMFSLQGHQDIQQRIHITNYFALRQRPEQFLHPFFQAFAIGIGQHDIIVFALDETIKHARQQWVTQAH